MPFRVVVTAFLLVFALGCHDRIFPGTISSCTLNSDGLTQTCDLYEGSSKTSGPIDLINPVTAGFVVLVDKDLISWSDIVWFPDDGSGLASRNIELFSGPFDFSVLPFNENEVVAGATFVKVLPTDPTVFNVSTFGFEDNFRVFRESAIGAEIPEPSTLILLFPALIIMGTASWRRATDK